MPRGHYDRAAAKAKRDWNAIADAEPNVTGHEFIRPAWPYTNDSSPIMCYDVEADAVIPLTQEKFDAMQAMALNVAQERDVLREKLGIVRNPLHTSDIDAANAKIAKYDILLKKHGLWLDE